MGDTDAKGSRNNAPKPSTGLLSCSGQSPKAVYSIFYLYCPKIALPLESSRVNLVHFSCTVLKEYAKLVLKGRLDQGVFN